MAGPSAQLRRLGAELRRLREAADMSQMAVAKAVGRTHASIVNWERGKTRISKSDLAYLLAELKAPVSVRKALEQLRDESGQRRGWWSVYDLPDQLRPLVSFEQDATKITNFEPIIIPGLLHTERYTRALHTAHPYTTSPDEVDHRVAVRMERQRRLAGPKRVRLNAVIAEAALHLEVGGSEVMAEQLARLLTASKSSTITVRILPNSVGAHPGQASNFTVLHFADPKADRPLGYTDGPLGGYIIDDEGDVVTLVSMFNDIRRLALSEADSRKLIDAVMKEHERRATSNARDNTSPVAKSQS